jgi:Cu2+-exporting ATPase
LEKCYHCHQPVPEGASWRLAVLGAERRFCCAGCHAVSLSITGAGLEDYYRYRNSAAMPGTDPSARDRAGQNALYDRPEIQESFVRTVGASREALLVLEDIRCEACLWLNEQHVRRLPGVLEADIDFTSQRARVRWDPQRTTLGEILRSIADIGYLAHPFDPAHRESLAGDRRTRSFERLLFAGLAGMPVMQFSLASYLAGASAGGTLPLWELIGRWSCLLVALAILAYSGQEFFVGAWRALRRGRLGMDVPIVLGLGSAFSASLVATLEQRGAVYFDGIAMFVFFVLLARALELRGRLAAAASLDLVAQILPATARRLRPDGSEQSVACADLTPGDRVRVLPGESAPVDGRVIEGVSTFDESALTGEAEPVLRGPGQEVRASTRNYDQAVVIEVLRPVGESAVQQIQRLLRQAVVTRPPAAALADSAARWFVAAVLVAAAATALAWLWIDASMALSSAIAVLIVTCPCALALATPVAVTVAAGRLAAVGVLPVRMGALERLAKVDMAAFDKTGTLTRGRPELVALETLGGWDPEELRAVAGALERTSEHPIALALKRADRPGLLVTGARNLPGAGVSGTIVGVPWRLGSAEFVLEGRAPTADLRERLARWLRRGCAVVLLGALGEPRALLAFRDELRPGAHEALAALETQGFRRLAVVSGDHPRAVRQLGASLGLREALGGMSPGDKLAWLRQRQAEGGTLLMVGDGVNDAPTLAAADVSVSFKAATELAQSQSDFIVLGEDLGALPKAITIARRTRSAVRTNLLWAGIYNLLAVPAAAAGLVPPWAAALGMSASSLLVVTNSLRLRGIAHPKAPVSGAAREGKGKGQPEVAWAVAGS